MSGLLSLLNRVESPATSPLYTSHESMHSYYYYYGSTLHACDVYNRVLM